MSKFWGAVFAVFLIGVSGLILASAAQEINFTDLETECREDRTSDWDVSVTHNNELEFKGHFPVENTKADMKYTYEKRGDRITLNVFSENDRPVEQFERDCNAVGVYEASTASHDGPHWVTLKHEGEQVYKTRINFR